MAKLYGSLEAGGTKFVCAVGDENFQVVEKTQLPTTTPYETIDRTIELFKRYEDQLAGIATVWYTHLTLPTSDLVQVSVIAESVKHK